MTEPTTEQWETDYSGFNVVERKPDGIATVATLQPHARIKERACLIAAAPKLRDAIADMLWCIDTGVSDERWGTACLKANDALNEAQPDKVPA